MSSDNIITLKEWGTKYNADSVEWCPLTPYHNIFVCGTYQLIQDCSTDSSTDCNEGGVIQTKLGYLYLLSINTPFNFCVLQTLELAGILDTKWCPTRVYNKVLLGVVTSKGELFVYEILPKDEFSDETGNNFSLEQLTKINVGDVGKNILALSLDWSFINSDEGKKSSIFISVSDSSGCVSLFKLDDLSLKLEVRWKLHEFEAWITAFDYWKPNVIYSGGDDMKFFVLDSRIGEKPVLMNKSHEMGVTSIHCNKTRENCLISGSYDETLRFWDTRNMKKPSSSLPLIGGIWRLKWSPRDSVHIIAACMYGGFCIICAEVTGNSEIVGIYKEHKDIAYGADWSYHSKNDVNNLFVGSDIEEQVINSSVFATCSFYDHKLCISAIKEK